MHFINSLLLAFAAAAIAAPTPANVLGRDASEVDQMQSGLEGASSIAPLNIVSRPKGSGRPPGSPNTVTSNPNHPPWNNKREEDYTVHPIVSRPKGSSGYTGKPNSVTNNPNHPRDAAKGGRRPGAPNTVTNNPNHPRADCDATGSTTHPIVDKSGSNPATHCC